MSLAQWHVCLRWFMVIAVCGCTACTATRPREGGKAIAAGATVWAPQDPAATTRQVIVRTQFMVTLAPSAATGEPGQTSHVPTHAAGARRQPGAQPAAHAMDELPVSAVPNQELQLAHQPRGARTNFWLMAETVMQEIGPTLRDESAVMRARAAALRPAQWLGLALIGLGVAAGIIPGLRAFIGSGTTIAGMVIGGTGLALSPALVPGREAIVMTAVLVLLAIYWWAHRHGELRGKANGISAPTNRP